MTYANKYKLSNYFYFFDKRNFDFRFDPAYWGFIEFSRDM